MMQSCKPAVAGIVTKKPTLAGKLVLRPLDTRYSYFFLMSYFHSEMIAFQCGDVHELCMELVCFNNLEKGINDFLSKYIGCNRI